MAVVVATVVMLAAGTIWTPSFYLYPWSKPHMMSSAAELVVHVLDYAPFPLLEVVLPLVGPEPP